MTQLLSLLADPRRWRFVLALIFIIGAGWIYLFRVPITGNATSALRASPQVGFLAPDFTLGTSDGRQVMLSTLRGQVVLVNLWASWCPPCRAEMPAIDKVYRANHARGLTVLAVDAANQDSESDARSFAQKLDLSFPILLDRSGSVGQRYHLRALPTSYFIDRHGVIRSVVMGGPMSEALIGSKIEDLLREAP